MALKEYITKEEILALGNLDPQFAALKAANPFPNAPWDQPEKLRSGREEDVRKKFESLDNPGTIFNVPMRDGHISPIRVYKPKPASEGSKPSSSPLMVLIYGGGFVSGDNRQLAAFAVQLNALYNATVVLLSYRLAPEHPFPAAQNDVWDSLLWISENVTPTGALSEADPSAGFIIGGVSAGGNLSASLAQKWVDEAKTPHITGLWLSIPLIFYDHSHVPVEYKDAYLASEQNADADIINSTAIHWVNIHQSPDPKSPLFSPFNSEHPEKHVNLGKAGIRVYFQVAGADPLRDDGLIYERVLRKSGVETRIDVYPGVPHAHFAYFPFLDAAKRSNEDTFREFGWLLRQNE